MKFFTLNLMLAIALAATASAAEDPASKSDQPFVTKAGQGGMAEVALGKLATTKASDDRVKAFAKMMVEDHAKANAELMATAKRAGADVPSSPSSAQQATKASLEAMDGMAFDRHYTEVMVKDHAETIALFKTEAADGANADLKTFATKTLPTLEHHGEMARELQKSIQSSKH